MGKRLTPVDKFFIENHKDLSIEALAKIIGCTPRTIYNCLNKNTGEQRTEEGRTAAKEGKLPPPNTESIPSPPIETPPAKTIDMSLLGRRKNGTSSCITMTKEASEIGDEIMKNHVPPVPDYIHVINPNKKD